MNVTDSELLMLVKEHNEDAEQMLFDRYKYIIDIISKKYKFYNNTTVDNNDIYQQALIGFYEAIYNYDEKSTSLASFITLCINRKLITMINVIQNHNRLACLGLDYIDDNLCLENTNNPSFIKEEQENVEILLNKIRNQLSMFEIDVFNLFINSYTYVEIAEILHTDKKKIDNAIQRIKRKVKTLLV